MGESPKTRNAQGLALHSHPQVFMLSYEHVHCTGLRTDSARYADSIASFEKMVERNRMDVDCCAEIDSVQYMVGDAALSLS